MKTKLTSLVMASALLAGASFNASATMDKNIELSLIDICKSAISNKPVKMMKTIKSYRVKEKVIAEKLVCNGDNVIDFAEKHDALKNASRLKRHLGKVTITDIAAVNKWSVNF